MARLGDMARIFIGKTEVSDAGEFNHEILNNLLLQKGIDPETGLIISSVAEVGEEMLERADEITLNAVRALLPSFRRDHPSSRYLAANALLEENPQRALKLIAAYMSLTANGSMPEYGLVMAHDERYDCREKARSRDEALALKELKDIKRAEEHHRFEMNLGREEGLDAEYPEEENLSSRKERLEKRLSNKTIAGFEQLVRDEGKEIARWLAGLSDEELDFFIGDSAPYLTVPSRLKRFGGKEIVFKDPGNPKSPVKYGVLSRVINSASFAGGYKGRSKQEVAEEIGQTWVLAAEPIQERMDAPDAARKRNEGWGVGLWESSVLFARSYDISGREGELTGRDKAIAAIAITYGKYTRTGPALAWGGFLSTEEARDYLDSLKLTPDKLEQCKARIFGAMKFVYRERQDYIEYGVVPIAERFAREVWHCITHRELLSNTEKLVAAIGLLHSPYLVRRRSLGLNWGGFDSLNEVRLYLDKFPVPLPKDTLNYLRKKVTYAIYEQAPKQPKEAA